MSLKKAQLSDLDSLAQSIFYDMFGDPIENEKGWEVKKIGEIASFYNGKAHENVIDEDGKYIVVNAKYIASNGNIIKKTNEQLFPLYTNDIVMVMSDVPNGKALARCSLITSDNSYSLNQRICAFREYKQNPIYLLFVLNRNSYFLGFDDGNGQTNLRKNEVINCPVPLPPLSLQQEFAKRIELIEQQKAQISSTIKDLETLLASRMQYWFD
jgi:type I restriction enzyme S subunit